MTLNHKRIVIAVLSAAFLASLLIVQWLEARRKAVEMGARKPDIHVPTTSKKCVSCHEEKSPGIVEQWKDSTHAEKGVGCLDCHIADEDDADGYLHEGARMATIVTPKDCARCHPGVFEEFTASHHAKAGNILASLDNFLAEVVEGGRRIERSPTGKVTLGKEFRFEPHSPTIGRPDLSPGGMSVNGAASASTGCKQCHGSQVALLGTDGAAITVRELAPDSDGKPTNKEAFARIARDENGRPSFDHNTWPNTGIGRINLDGSIGACSACHSRHDFSPRRARRPESCGKCHLGPDHPQKEIYEESKHGIAYRDLKNEMNLDGKSWVLGKDYTQAPTCATCHMSGHVGNDGKITHDAGARISWTNRPPVSVPADTTADHDYAWKPAWGGAILDDAQQAAIRATITDTWKQKRQRMGAVCANCHTPDYVKSFYKQYDDFLVNYNEKFAKPGAQIMAVLAEAGLRTKSPQFDDPIEWTWFYLWHHEGRRARHGASMMAPDYAHWHGMFEVAERFYKELIPEAQELAAHAEAAGEVEAAKKVRAVVDRILARPEHEWSKRPKKLEGH